MTENNISIRDESLASESKHLLVTNLIPLVDWPKRHSWPPLGGLRHMAFWAPPGSERVFVRCGRRILINEPEFFKWVSTNPKIQNISGKRKKKPKK